MKLNLGCNTRIRPDYINIDFDKREGVNFVCDVSNLSMFENGVADEVYSSHILEHFPHTKTLDVLKEWHRVLKVGGVLKISVPDFERAIEIYHKVGLQDWVVNFLWGDQCYPGAFHYTAFDDNRLRDLLVKAGFSEVSRVETLPGAQPDECSMNVSNLDGRYVSLSMVAVK